MHSLKHALHLLAVAVALSPVAVSAQYFDLSPSAILSEVPRFSVPFTIELRITNAGPDQAVGVVVNHTVPPGLTILSAEVYGCVVQGGTSYCYDPAYPVSSTINGNVIQCQAGRIPAGWYRPIFIRVMAPVPGSYVNQTVIAYMPWELPGNNSITFPVDVHSHGLLVKGGGYVPEQSGGNATFTVQLVPSNSVPVTVDYRAVGITATAGEDFQAVSGSLVFPPGITSQTVSVPVLDDTLQEPYSQSFTLLLTNAVNAEVDPNPQPCYVVDNEPPLQMAISNAAPVLEGDGETVNAVFDVHLVGLADVPVTVDYTAGPPVSKSGTLVIPAGVTNQPLNISFNGNLTVESNRVFDVTLSNPAGVTSIILNQATAQGTILDDDAVPGKFHHMNIDAVPSPQIAGRPFPVTLRTFDYQNNPATNFAGTVSLGAYDVGGGQPNRFIDVSNFVAGIATVNVTYTNKTTNAVFGAWLWMGSYYATALSSNFKVIPSPPLFLSTPVSAAEGDGVLTGAGRVSITNLDGQDLVVQLSSSDPLEISVPPTVYIPAGQTSAVFDVTIVDDTRLDGAHSTFIYANATAYIGTSKATTIQDNESAVLNLTLPAGLSELKGFNSGTGTISASSPPALPILVNLSSSDTTELTVPCCIYIQAGQTSATFTASVPDDTIIDGPQSVNVTAHVANWTDGLATTTVLDDDTNITVTLFLGNDIAIEGLGTKTNGLQVRLGGFTSNDVVVQLISSDITEAIIPSSVLIRAGQQTVNTNITLPDDSETDGTQSVTITATAPGFVTGTRTFNVLDNDAHHFVIGAIPASQTSGVPFRITVTVKDVSDAVMNNFRENVSVSALRAGSVLPVTPSVLSNFVRGAWTGNVTINQWGTNVQLSVTSSNGASGLSNPFTLPMPAWAENLRISRLQFEGADLRLFFNTVTGKVYQLEAISNLATPFWYPVGPSQPGTGGEMSASDSGAAAQPTRFYRLAVPIP
jgi:hypothetical protein